MYAYHCNNIIPQENCVVSEKKLGKSFQYDMPGDLVMTYLAEVSV